MLAREILERRADDDERLVIDEDDDNCSIAEASNDAGAASAQVLAHDKAIDNAVDNGDRKIASENVDEESERLNLLVKTFEAKALKGCPCTCFVAGERVKTHYVVDKSLQNLVVLDMAGTSGRQFVCPIVSIVDIYTVTDDCIDVFPHEVARTLKAHEQESLFMVVFSDINKLYRFCILEESLEGRVMFYIMNR